jgi:hypothetical protein
MSDGAHLTTWVTRATKERFAAVARHQGLSDSALLKRLVELMLHTAGAGIASVTASRSRPLRGARFSVRLCADDQLLLHERAAARSLAPATYASILIQAHLRTSAPIPAQELRALRESVTALDRIGTNLNQMAVAIHRGGGAQGSRAEDLRAMLKACEGLRDHVRSLIKANVLSWRSSNAPPHR